MSQLSARLIKILVTVMFFILYWKLFEYIFDAFIPLNAKTQVLSLLIMILLIPLSIISMRLVEKAFR